MEKTRVKIVMSKLHDVKGLGNIHILREKDRDVILNMEEEENHGVQECLDRQYTLVLTHTSNFRKPEGEIVKNEDGKIVFPGVKFSEVNAKDVVSSSPGKEVYEFLVKKFKLILKDEATLLVGFNL